MASTPAAAPVIDVRDTFGLLVIGTIIGTIFYGMTLLQTGVFFGKVTGEERTRTTALVVLLCLLDTFTWTLEVYTSWFYFVVNYTNPAALAVPVWTLKLEPGFTYTVAFMAQMYFVEKIYLLSRNKFILAFMGLISLAAWICGLAITGIVFHTDSLVTPDIDHINIAQKTLSTLIEVLIAGTMCYMFTTRHTGVKRTDNILFRLIVFAATRGVLMGVVQILYTITFFAYQDKLIWVVFHFTLGKLCTNSVLASLNIREIVRGGTGVTQGTNSIALKPTTGTRTGHDTHVLFRHDASGMDQKLSGFAPPGQDVENLGGIQVDTVYFKHAD